jgi:hypothetical protein
VHTLGLLFLRFFWPFVGAGGAAASAMNKNENQTGKRKFETAPGLPNEKNDGNEAEDRDMDGMETLGKLFLKLLKENPASDSVTDS